MSRRVALTIRNIGAGGGLEKYATRIAKGFATKGDIVTIVTTKGQLDGFEMATLPLKRFFSSRKMVEFDSLCKKWAMNHTPDIVFAMDRTTHQTHLRAGNGCHAAYLKRCPHKLTTLHKTVLSLEKKAFESPTLTRLFTNSNMVRDEILSNYTTSPGKIAVVHNGVEWHEFQESFDAINLSHQKYHFLFVGHGFARKGLADLLFGLEGLNAKLSVIGKDHDIKHYKRLSDKLRLDTTFYGAVNPLPFYKQADALVIPSHYDPFANVTVEALAMGLLVVSSRTNGGHEVLSAQNGIIIDDMREALKKAIERPKTKEQASTIRDSVKHLDFSNQIPKLIDG